ncbi:MAG: hypothetical protein KAR11_03645 [Phycisphaerae bacterium]|nr:hypothetical protein [Phycisphaerae bacterium]
MELVLGIDLGTSYFKLGLFNRGGDLVGLGRIEVPMITGLDETFELPADRFWDTLRKGLSSALQQAKATPADIKGIGYSSQANTVMLLDCSDNPLTPLISWKDQRGASEVAALQQLWNRDDFLHTTGLGIAPGGGFAAAKLLWIRRNQPAVWSRAVRAMTISDYLLFNLTGSYVGDAGSASLLGLLDQTSRSWWGEAMTTLELQESLFSQPLTPGTPAGKTPTGNPLGLPPDIPVAAGSLDHHFAAVGAGAGAENTASVAESTGTVLAALLCTDKYDPKPNSCTGAGTQDGYYQLAFDSNGASVLEWYQRTFAPKLSVGDLVKRAGGVSPGCDGLIALPYCNTYPHLDGFTNRNDRHTQGHFARAIMESVALSLKGLLGNLIPAGELSRVVSTGGGAKSDLWLQIKANMLNAEFVRTNCLEPAARGAAKSAAVTAGWFPSLQQASETWTKIVKVFEPQH